MHNKYTVIYIAITLITSDWSSAQNKKLGNNSTWRGKLHKILPGSLNGLLRNVTKYSRIFLWFALPTSGFSFERVLVCKLPTGPFSSGKPNSEVYMVGTSGLGQCFLWLYETQQGSWCGRMPGTTSKRKAQSQVLAKSGLHGQAICRIWLLFLVLTFTDPRQNSLWSTVHLKKKKKKWH